MVTKARIMNKVNIITTSGGYLMPSMFATGWMNSGDVLAIVRIIIAKNQGKDKSTFNNFLRIKYNMQKIKKSVRVNLRIMCVFSEQDKNRIDGYSEKEANS